METLGNIKNLQFSDPDVLKLSEDLSPSELAAMMKDFEQSAIEMGIPLAELPEIDDNIPLYSKEIEITFLETNYIILLEHKITLKIGEIPFQLFSDFPHIKTWAFITAWNPLPDILSKSQNDFRNNQLQAQLKEEAFKRLVKPKKVAGATA